MGVSGAYELEEDPNYPDTNQQELDCIVRIVGVWWIPTFGPSQIGSEPTFEIGKQQTLQTRWPGTEKEEKIST